jgi:hypothetical protein
MTNIDYRFESHGSVCLVHSVTDDAYQWLHDHVESEAQWMGKALAVEHRYALPLAMDLQAEGYVCVFEPVAMAR